MDTTKTKGVKRGTYKDREREKRERRKAMAVVFNREEPLEVSLERCCEGIEAAVSAMKRYLWDRGSPRGIPVEDLDESQLEAIAMKAISGWFHRVLDTVRASVCEKEEMEEMLPELEYMPIDWERPMAQWSREKILKLLQAMTKLIIDRYLKQP
jgi:hypothetical protein